MQLKILLNCYSQYSRLNLGHKLYFRKHELELELELELSSKGVLTENNTKVVANKHASD